MSPGYDDWLEAPYQRMYRDSSRSEEYEEYEELVGESVYFDDGEGAWYIEDFQVDVDEDEDGKHLDVTFELSQTYEKSNGTVGTHTIYKSEYEVKDAIRAHIEHLASAPGPTHKERERLEAILKRTYPRDAVGNDVDRLNDRLTDFHLALETPGPAGVYRSIDALAGVAAVVGRLCAALAAELPREEASPSVSVDKAAVRAGAEGAEKR